MLLEILDKNPLPNSFRLLAEFSSLLLEDFGSHFLDGLLKNGKMHINIVKALRSPVEKKTNSNFDIG